MDDSALQNIQSNMDDLESEIVGQVNEKKFEARKEKFQSILGDTKLELSEGTDLVKKGMQVFDQVREAEACLKEIGTIHVNNRQLIIFRSVCSYRFRKLSCY